MDETCRPNFASLAKADDNDESLKSQQNSTLKDVDAKIVVEKNPMHMNSIFSSSSRQHKVWTQRPFRKRRECLRNRKINIKSILTMKSPAIVKRAKGLSE